MVSLLGGGDWNMENPLKMVIFPLNMVIFHSYGVIVYNLVGGDWNMEWIVTFHSVGNGTIIPTDFRIFFRGVGIPPTSLLEGKHHGIFNWLR